MNSVTNKRINLALQGGGAHGAFTWGVLDKFLESNLFTIEAISATSAGSVNAVMLTQGLLNGGNDGARQMLYDFWHAISKYAELFHNIPIDFICNPFLKTPISYLMFNSIINMVSPYQFNPYNYQPLREVLEKFVDMEKIRQQNLLKLFICATNIRNGKIKIFNNEELSYEAVLASTCMPKFFQAVEIDNEYYWDGGYLGNPAIFPLIYNTNVSDVIIVQTITVNREIIPKTVNEIDTRLREISFNSSLMREMRAIAFVTKLIENDMIKDEYKTQLKKMYMHCIRADQRLAEFTLASVYSPDWDFLLQLHQLGREVATNWLNMHYDSIAKATTVNFDDWL